MPVTSKDAKGEPNSPEMPNVLSCAEFKAVPKYIDIGNYYSLDSDVVAASFAGVSKKEAIAMLFGLCSRDEWQLYTQVEGDYGIYYDKGNRFVNRTGVYAAVKRKAISLQLMKKCSYSFGDRGVTYVSSEGKKLKIK